MMGMYHNDFNDFLFFRNESDRSRNTGGAIDPEKGFRILAELTVNYLDNRLKNRKNGGVIDLIKTNPELTVEFPIMK